MIDAPNGRRWLQLDEHFREVTCDGVVMLAPIIVARSQPEIISAVLRSDGRQCFAVVLMASESQGRLITVPSTVRFMHTHNWRLLLALVSFRNIYISRWSLIFRLATVFQNFRLSLRFSRRFLLYLSFCSSVREGIQWNEFFIICE
jgi:hypothetical protein